MSQAFTIYLLKTRFKNIGMLERALVPEHNLKPCPAEALPERAKLFVPDSFGNLPWWGKYFAVTKRLNQAFESALLFVPAGGRWFIFSFGSAYHKINKDIYEYDFGLRVTLNSIDPNKIISTDGVELDRARKQRTQVPVGSSIVDFDFDGKKMLKSITGKVKDEHKDDFTSPTGSASLHIKSTVESHKLPSLCANLLSLYACEDYKKTFPDLLNILSIKDPDIIAELDGILLETFKKVEPDDKLILAIPDIVDYADVDTVKFSGVPRKRSESISDIFINPYYVYLHSNGQDIDEVTIDHFCHHRINFYNPRGHPVTSYRIYDCFLFDVYMNGKYYHLYDGEWYEINSNYVRGVERYIDGFYEGNLNFPEHDSGNEYEYNNRVAELNKLVCLDTEMIQLPERSKFEACDLYTVVGEQAVFYHVKISTASGPLSHLFSQGKVSARCIKSEDRYLNDLKNLIKKKMVNGKTLPEQVLLAPLDREKRNVYRAYKVVFVMVTHKDENKKSKNMPVFSRINFKSVIAELISMGVEVSFGFVKNNVSK